MFGINRFRLGALGGSPTRKPTLNLNFIGSASLDSRITFTRASNATYFDSTGTLQTAGNDVARLDYDPVTLAARGLLIEEQRTNVLTYSEEFDNAAWGGSNVTLSANATTSPTGATTADKLIATSANSEHTLTQNFSVTSGTTYTFTAFVKAAGLTNIGLRFTIGGLWTGGASPQTRYDLTTVATSTITGSPASASITDVGGGYYRIQMSVVAAGTGTGGARLQLMSGANNTFTGNDADGVFVWGAQLEAGAFPTSYIPTTAASATRNADAASMTGTNFSSWYNATEGALFAEASPLIAPLLSPGRPVFFLTNGTTSSIDIRFRPTQKAGMAVIDAGSTQVDSASTGNYSTSINKLAGAYLVNNFASTLNAESPVADTSGTVPSGLSSAFIASDGTNRFNGYIRRLAYYPRRLSNAELQSITS